MLHGLVPDLGLVRKTSKDFTRAGFTLQPIRIKAATSGVRTKIQNSLLHQGVKIFNSLPEALKVWNSSFDVFNTNLDKFLETVPNNPRNKTLKPNCKDFSGNNYSNFIKDWVHIMI